MALTPAELRAHLAQGALFAFPVTPFTAEGALDLAQLHAHLEYVLAHGPDALCICGGTGEFSALTAAEWRAAVAAAVEEVRGTVPLLAGCGYGTAMACEGAREAAALGCDGVLVMPPYLVAAEQEGLYAHYAAVATAAPLGVVPYQRDQAVFAPETVARLAALPTVVAFKDGLGEVERLQRIALLTEGRLPLINGLPTAEVSQTALGALGANSYSSAVFNFMPSVALRFYRAWRAGDRAATEALLTAFYRPFCELRDRRRGYAVSLIKAGLRVCGRPCGPVRPPLVEATPEHVDVLRALLRAIGVEVRG
jgi:5-dehydro-4-deoxyglucarate dehydratase